MKGAGQAAAGASRGQEKEQIRSRMKALRAQMDEGAHRSASASILERLLRLPEFVRAKGVHCYASLPREVETEAIFSACWDLGKRTYLPYQIPAARVLGVARRFPHSRLEPGPFGVPEVPAGERAPVDRAEIDLVVVPGVAFDRAGRRLGYGLGYYDRFLAGLGSAAGPPEVTQGPWPGPFVVGLAFQLQLVARLPADDLDESMDAVLTERELVRPR